MKSPWSAAFAVILLTGCSGSVRRSLDTLEEGNEVAVNVDSKDHDGEAGVQSRDASPATRDGGSPDGGRLAECGNGEVEGDEGCDDGQDNSNDTPGACRLNCTPPRCGDGVIDDGEACDDGEANSDSEPDACRTDCSLPSCGDGVPDKGEDCDTGDARSDTEPDACRTDCRDYRCGDGVLDSNEPCERGTDGCNDDCTLPSCGDGDLNEGEQCDDGNRTDGDGCQGNCLTPRCGDGVRDLDRNEECDDGNSNNNDGCRSDCKTGCTGADGCANELFCDGAEQCVDGICTAGSPPQRDGPACVMYSCDEGEDAVTAALDHRMCASHGRTVCDPETVTKTTYPGRCDEARGCIQAGDGISERCPTPAPVCEGGGADGRTDADTPAHVTFRPTCNRAGTDCSAARELHPCPRSICRDKTTVVHGAPTCDPDKGCGLEPQKEEPCSAIAYCQDGQICRNDACVVGDSGEAQCRTTCRVCPGGRCIQRGDQGAQCVGVGLIDAGIVLPPTTGTLAP